MAAEGGGDRWRRSLEPRANWLAGGAAELSGGVRSVPACQGEALIIRFAHPCGRAGAAGSEGAGALAESTQGWGGGDKSKQGRHAGAGEAERR